MIIELAYHPPCYLLVSDNWFEKIIKMNQNDGEGTKVIGLGSI